MATTYKPKPKVSGVCICGCGRTFEGNAGRKYYEPYCRLKVFLAKREGQEEAA